MTNERRARALIFGEAADAYARARPRYPPAATDALVDATGLQPGDRVLEIGCGTGQATTALARHGLHVVALEPSPSMAALARRELAEYERVRIVESTFEAFNDPEPYDAVVAALSFHWLDPSVRMHKIHAHLRGDGHFAALTNIHPRPFTGFFARAQTVYRDLVPEWDDLETKQNADDKMRDATEVLQAERTFEITATGAWDWELRFTSAGYCLLLSTFSDHRLLGPDRLAQVQRALGELIDQEYGGSVVRPYRTLLTVARKVG